MKGWLAGIGVAGVVVWLRSRRNREVDERRARIQANMATQHGPYTWADIEAMKWDD